MSFQPAGSLFRVYISKRNGNKIAFDGVFMLSGKVIRRSRFFVLTAEAWLCPRLVSVCRGSGGFQARGSNAGGVILLAFRREGPRTQPAPSVAQPGCCFFCALILTSVDKRSVDARARPANARACVSIRAAAFHGRGCKSRPG